MQRRSSGCLWPVACRRRYTGNYDRTGTFSADFLDDKSPYPQPGVIAGEMIGRVLDPAGRDVIQIDTERPDFVESVEGATRFEVFAESLVEG
jgi:hypothetical protein